MITVAYNARSLINSYHKLALETLTLRYKPHVVLVNEKWFALRHSLRIPGYQGIRADLANGDSDWGGGTCVLF